MRTYKIGKQIIIIFKKCGNLKIPHDIITSPCITALNKAPFCQKVTKLETLTSG